MHCSDRGIRSRASGKLLAQALCCITFTSLLLCRFAAGGEPKRARVVVCSNEPALSREAFASQLQGYLEFADVDVSDRCLVPAEAEAFLARFVAAPDRSMRLQVETVHAPPRIRSLPWLEAGSPIGQTLRRGNVPAFALLLEAMLLEFDSIQLLRAPPLPAASVAPEGRTATPPVPAETPAVHAGTPELPAEVSEGQVTFAQRSVPRQADGSRRHDPLTQTDARSSSTGVGAARLRRPRLGLRLEAGVACLPETVIAPAFGLGSIYDSGRWGAVLALRGTSDSNFTIGDRGFETATYSLGMGPRLRAFERDPLWLGADLLVLGALNRYRRDDLPNAATRQWFDLGFGAEGVGRLRLFGEVWVLVLAGLHWIPTAKTAQIKDGPRRDTGQMRIPLLIGSELFF